MGLPKSYFLVKSTRLNIIANHFSCGLPGSTCNDKMAVRFEKSVLTFSVNEAASEQPKYTLNNYGEPNGIMIHKQDTQSVIVRTSDGVEITITFGKWATKWYINIAIMAPGFYSGQVTGLCGTYSGKADSNSNLEQYAVSASENLFQCHHTCSGYKTDTKQEVGIQCVTSPPKGYETPPKVVEPVPRPNIVITPPIIPPPNKNEEVEKYCERIFTKLNCGKKIDIKFYLNACKTDGKQGVLADIARDLTMAFQQEW
jgi:hypothetical protein